MHFQNKKKITSPALEAKRDGFFEDCVGKGCCEKAHRAPRRDGAMQ